MTLNLKNLVFAVKLAGDLNARTFNLFRSKSRLFPASVATYWACLVPPMLDNTFWISWIHTPQVLVYSSLPSGKSSVSCGSMDTKSSAWISNWCLDKNQDGFGRSLGLSSHLFSCWLLSSSPWSNGRNLSKTMKKIR